MEVMVLWVDLHPILLHQALKITSLGPIWVDLQQLVQVLLLHLLEDKLVLHRQVSFQDIYMHSFFNLLWWCLVPDLINVVPVLMLCRLFGCICMLFFFLKKLFCLFIFKSIISPPIAILLFLYSVLRMMWVVQLSQGIFVWIVSFKLLLFMICYMTVLYVTCIYITVIYGAFFSWLNIFFVKYYL